MSDEARPTAPSRPLDRLHSALSRVTASGRYDAVVDGLRFVSIFGVLLFHLGSWHEDLARAGDGVVEQFVARTAAVGRFGVQLFFAISGLILARPFAEAASAGRPAPGARDYYLRRVCRIEPPYLVCVLVLFAVHCVHRAGQGRDTAGWGSLAAMLTYTYSTFFGARQTNVIDPVTWSLEVEVRFYLLAPLLFFAVFRSPPAVRRVALVVAAAGWAAWFAATRTWTGAVDADIASQAGWFLAGIFVVDAETSRDGAARASPPAWDAAATGAAATLWLLVQREGVESAVGAGRTIGTFMGPACVALFFLGVMRGRVWRSVLSNRWISVVGGMCYSIYLWHFPLIRTLRGRLPWKPAGGFLAEFALHAALLVPAAIVVGAVLFVLVEKPFMRRDWPRRVRALWKP